MPEAGTWRTLRVPDDAPKLLVKTRFDDNGYDIQMTDLSRIWGETLTKEAIVRRAGNEGCSIDASEDDQYQILLEKIGRALDSSDDTALRIMPSDNGLEISLEISAKLPGSLPTFMWYPNLQRRPGAALAFDFVIPLVLQAYNLQYNIEQLIDEIACKDRVIAKITDRLETSGNDLTTVFPGVSNIRTNRRRSQREQLASHVKGLADFDEDSWRASSAQTRATQEVSDTVLDVVLRGIPASGRSGEHIETVDDWWRVLGIILAGGSALGRGATNTQLPKADPQQASRTPVNSKHEAGGFQRQDTHAHVRQRAGTPSTVDNDHISPMEVDVDVFHKSENKDDGDETTEDEDDLKAPPSKSSSQTKGRSQEEPATSIPQRSAPRKLGVVGGKKVTSEDVGPSRDVPLARQPGTKAKLGMLGGKVKSKTPDPEPQDAEEAPNLSPPKPKSKLGMIGGKAKATPEATVSPPAKSTGALGKFGGKRAKESTPLAQDEVPESPARQLGVMGGSSGRRAASQPPLTAQEDTERQSRSVKREDEVEEEREPSEERADKKRERLKRELEEKAKAPVKKKRRF